MQGQRGMAGAGQGEYCGDRAEYDAQDSTNHQDFLVLMSRQHRRVPDRKSTTSELQSLMRISYAVFCLTKKTTHVYTHHVTTTLHSHKDILYFTQNKTVKISKLLRTQFN